MKRIWRLILSILLLCILTGCQFYKSINADLDLVDALGRRNLAEIERAAENGANLDRIWMISTSLNPILYTWRQSPNTNIAKTLLAAGADVNYADSKGRTLLMFASGADAEIYSFEYAARKGSNYDYCELFLQYGADVTATDSIGWCATDYAVSLDGEYWLRILKLLRSYDAPFSKETLNIAVNTVPDGIYQYQKIRYLVEELDLSQQSVSLSPALQAAILGESEQVLQQYEDPASADPALPFYVAAYCDVSAIKKICVQSEDAIPCDAYGNSYLDVAAMLGNDDGVAYLLESYSWPEENKNSALKYAVDGGNVQSARLLLEHGATFQQSGIWEWANNIMDTPAETGNVEMIELLVEYEYPVTESTAWRAMRKAAKGGAIATIAYFEALGYDIDYRANNTDGDESVLCEACSYEQIEVVQYLVAHGADVNAKQKCLPEATLQGNYELVYFLVSCGADPNGATVYSDGSVSSSAYEIAVKYGYTKIIELFDGAENNGDA